MVRDVAKWDYLVSPSPACSEIFRRAFGFEGEIWETGYPRNDVLRSPSAGARRAEVRRGLGIQPDALVVLHAPTWRDDDRSDEGSFQHRCCPGCGPLAEALPQALGCCCACTATSPSGRPARARLRPRRQRPPRHRRPLPRGRRAGLRLLLGGLRLRRDRQADRAVRPRPRPLPRPGARHVLRLRGVGARPGDHDHGRARRRR